MMTRMHRSSLQWLLALPIVAAAACGGGSSGKASGGSGVNDGGAEASKGEGGGGSSSGGEAGSPGDDDSGASEGGPLTGSNVVPVIVNAGPAGTDSVNVPFISVTVCIPGTSTCQTVDYVSVDTGSSGLRILSSALSGLALPQVNATTGSPLAECYQFDDGYTWGSVRTADLKIGGETAAAIPLQVIGDPAFTSVPTDCSSSGPPENTVADFGGNGLIGINQLIPDCGDYCADTTNVATGSYYSCAGATCTAVAVADAAQVPNPIASFGADGNGAMLQFPTVPDTGAKTLTGSLVFGIGTQANNGLGSATVQTVDQYGDMITVFNGKTMGSSFIDSGTNALSFNDTSLTQCPAGGDLDGWYCPATPASLTAQNKGINGATTSVAFTVESTETLFNTSSTAFDDLADTGIDNTTFDWGFPFFIGRSVFIGLDGATTPGGKGPYVAY
jgi:hypothetical protein